MVVYTLLPLKSNESILFITALYLQGIGRQCPMYLEGSKNELTGRKIIDRQTIDYILKLHNEIRSKIARGRCDQPIAGCMKPLVCRLYYYLLSMQLNSKNII